MSEQSALAYQDRRQTPRAHLNEPARLRPNDWSSIEVEVINVSAGGFQARCDASLKIHSYVSLEVPAFGVVSARVVWCKDGRFGGRFVQPIDPRLCSWLHSESGGDRLPQMARLRLLRDKRGATAIEYGMIIAFIAIAAVVAIKSVATATTAKWNVVSENVSNHMAG
jgi:pilus assembly protein Flp/PilA